MNASAPTTEHKLTPGRVIVIDDDPTGCQTVANVPVVTRWEPDDLRWLPSRNRPMGFVLTNSRAMHAEEPASVNGVIVDRALAIGAELNLRLSVLSRSDSTLRGHFTAEVGSVCQSLAASGQPVELILFAPAFFEAGRITRDDVHYVQHNGSECPVAETAYASDATFGFAESNLLDWVRARLFQPDADVTSLPLSLLREGGADPTVEFLRGLLGRSGPPIPPVVVVNATTQADWATILTRCGPSYVASRLGEDVPEAISALPVARTRDAHGMIVVGSHVPVSTAQLDTLVDQLHPLLVELDPVAVVGPRRQEHVEELTAAVCEGLAGVDVVLATSRRLRTQRTPGPASISPPRCRLRSMRW